MLTRLLFLFFSVVFAAYIKLDNPNINVHIVPHSHWDVGWLKTIQEYYDENVQFVISHVVENNENNLDLRFSFSEMFVKKTPNSLQNLHSNVDGGQIDFTRIEESILESIEKKTN
jgi:hypothetical protein